MKTSIVGFKTDLRLHDNETLVWAIEQSDEIIPVYCFDEAHFKKTDFGFKKTGNFRTQFLLETENNPRVTPQKVKQISGWENMS